MSAETVRNHYRKQGVQVAKEQIIANILDRVADLRSCTKNDNCQELGELIESYIPEWAEVNLPKYEE